MPLFFLYANTMLYAPAITWMAAMDEFLALLGGRQ